MTGLFDNLNPQIVRLLPEETVRLYHSVPLSLEGNTLVVAMHDPHNLEAVDDISLQTGCEVHAVLASSEDILMAIDNVFSVEKKTKQTLIDMRLNTLREEKKTEASVEEEEETDALDDQPVVRLLKDILIGAITQKASDIHMEPQEPEMRIRYRIDGALHDVMTIPKSVEASLVSRAKVLSDMDITEKRRPQDGHYRFKHKGQSYDIRMACMHTVAGEKMVLRILDKSRMQLGLSDLGFSPDSENRIQNLITKPYGMIFVTGPTGSGKTTSLYAMLNMLDKAGSNIVTIEDPVEYRLPGINQTQVNVGAGMTFAAGLKAFLRQDPNVILVGEVRDHETAEIAVQAALTGHLVLSTLHTNDAPSAVTRLVEMGIEPFLVASTLIGVMAQRLARKVCVTCQGTGCESCMHTGMRGRTVMYELLEVDDAIRGHILRQSTASEVHDYMESQKMLTFKQCAMQKIVDGICSDAEARRVVFF